MSRMDRSMTYDSNTVLYAYSTSRGNYTFQYSVDASSVLLHLYDPQWLQYTFSWPTDLEE